MKYIKYAFILIGIISINLLFLQKSFAQPSISVTGSPPWETFNVSNSDNIIFEFERISGDDNRKIVLSIPTHELSFTIVRGNTVCISISGDGAGTYDCNDGREINVVVNEPGLTTTFTPASIGSDDTETYKVHIERTNTGLGDWEVDTSTNTNISFVRAIPDIIINYPAEVLSGQEDVTLYGSASVPIFVGSTSTTPSLTSIVWNQISGPGVTLTTSGSIGDAEFDAPTVAVDTNLEFEVTATDDESFTALETITVTVKAPVYPVDGVLLLDTSGSMGWHRSGSDNDLVGGCCSRLSSAKFAAKMFVDRLGAFATNSRIGVAIFPGEPHPSTVLGRRWKPTTGLADTSVFNTIKSDIGAESMTCSDCIEIPETFGTPTGIPVNWNGTPTSAGLDAAKGMLVPTPLPDETKSRIIVLLSDGAWNIGLDPADAGYLADFVTKGIHIYTVGIGEGSDNINAMSLENISIGTGVGTAGNPIGFNTYNVGDAATEPNLIPLFEKIMADMVSLNFAADPPSKISSGESKTHKVLVSNHDSIVSFTVSWESSKTDLLDFYLLSPGGARLNTQISSNGFKNITVNRERLEDPANVGEWELVVTYPTNATAAQAKEIAYNYSVITKSSLNMNVLLNKDKYFTGDSMILEARLIENNRRLKGATVEAKIRRPEEGIGNWHFLNRISENQFLEAPTEISGEPLTLVDRKNYVLLQKLKKKLPKVISEPGIVLNDKGVDGDKYPNDGIYAGKFNGFSVPGIYKFHVVATGKATNSQKFSREIEIHKFVDIAPDSAITVVEGAREKINEDGSGIIRVSVIPFDNAKNYLGPGYANEISITSSIEDSDDPVEDMLYGAYQKRFKLDDASMDPQIVITARDVKVYDDRFSKLIVPIHKWEVSAHLGYTIPDGGLSNNFDGGISGMLDLGYRFTKSWSAELLFGYHEFDNKGAGDDFSWVNTSFNGKYSYPVGIFRVFGNGGFGWYKPESGASALGWNVGGGLAYPYAPNWDLELGYNYHKVTKGDYDEFSTINLGIRYRFD